MTYDAVTWGAFACVLSALAGALTWRAYRRRGLAAGIHGAGWTLLPIAAWMTGTLRLAAEVLTDVGDWATRLVFSPTVWIGIVLAGVSGVLIGTGRLARRRSARGPASTAPGSAVRQPGRAKRVASGASTTTGAGEGDGEFDEIEAILRRHGIS